MGRDIRVRQVKKDVKMLDRAVTGTKKIRQSYVRTKEETQNDQNDPAGYAQEKISENAAAASRHMALQAAGKLRGAKTGKPTSDS